MKLPLNNIYTFLRLVRRRQPIEGSVMNANIGLILVIGFPLALCVVLWIFGKVSVRPE